MKNTIAVIVWVNAPIDSGSVKVVTEALEQIALAQHGVIDALNKMSRLKCKSVDVLIGDGLSELQDFIDEV